MKLVVTHYNLFTLWMSRVPDFSRWLKMLAVLHWLWPIAPLNPNTHWSLLTTSFLVTFLLEVLGLSEAPRVSFQMRKPSPSKEVMILNVFASILCYSWGKVARVFGAIFKILIDLLMLDRTLNWSESAQESPVVKHHLSVLLSHEVTIQRLSRRGPRLFSIFGLDGSRIKLALTALYVLHSLN
jgi:hypothetical protein